ncbi:MAG: BNR-repeat neuraminidase N-terminal domain-containing protein [Crocinitomicaceae bacterium]|nr:BNR-repeat neuraminidase N-terminal domain-containing protein [Crocinitomicaceae bacterium]
MKLIYSLTKTGALIFGVLLTTMSLGQSVTNTYSAGDIPTNLSSYSATCNGPMTPLVVTIPAGANVTGIDVSYNFTAFNGSWMSEQRSQIHCQETGSTEATANGTGGNAGGTESYSRTGVNIANGISATGVLTFEMQAWRTWGSAPAGCNANYQYINNTTWSITVHYTIPGPMSFTSSTTTQNNWSNAAVCSSNQEIIGIEVVTTGSTSPLDLTQFRIRTNGSTDPTNDVTNMDIYYTGTSSTFATTTLFASSATPPVGTPVFLNGTQTLASGTNYFWLVYDMNAGATLGNVVDGQCNRITVDGTLYVPTPINPVGNRTVAACLGTPGGTSEAVGVWLKANDGTTPSSGTGTLSNWTNHGSGGSIGIHGSDWGMSDPDFDQTGYNFNPKTHFNGNYNYLSLPDNGGVTYGSMYLVAELEDLSREYTHMCTYYNVSGPLHLDGNQHGGGDGAGNAQYEFYSSTFWSSPGDQSWRQNGNQVPHNENHTGLHDIVSAIAKFDDFDNYADRFLGGQHLGVDIPARDWLGDVSELIVLGGAGTAAEREQIESYLAIKYGLTLGVNGTTKDYVSTSNTVVWDQSANAGFNWDIAGISRDDATNQDQRKSHTEMWTAGVRNDIVTIANGTNFASPAILSADESFLVWGHNNGPTINTGSIVNYPTDNGENIETIFQREWKSQESGTVATVTLEFDLNSVVGVNGVIGNNDLANLRLLVDEDGDYSDGGATSIAPSSYNNTTNIAYFRIDFQPPSGPETTQNKGFYFTLGSTDAATTILPIEFGGFNFECSDNTQIEWTTLSENNTDRFEIEVSRDGEDFQFDGSVEAIENSLNTTEYAYSLTGNTGQYARIRQIDLDGAEKVYGPFSIHCDQSDFDLIAFPNPASKTLNIAAKGFTDATITIQDYMGKVVLTKLVNMKYTQVLDIQNLAGGIYTITLEGNSSRKVIKFLKSE